MITQKQLQKNIGIRIRQLREKKKISKDELAASIGKLKPVLQRIENGQVNPGIYTLREIAGGMGIKLEELLRDI